MRQPDNRGAVYAAINAHFGFKLIPAEMRLVDKALDQIKALREMSR